MKNLALIFILIPVFSSSQINIKGVICNSKKEPLPFTNVISVKTQNGTSTNSLGEFFLMNLNENDTLKISNIAYYSKRVSLKTFEEKDTIFLEDEIKLLNEVLITNMKNFRVEQDLGFLNYKNNASYDLKPGGQIAVFIENKMKREGWIKEVSFKAKIQGKCKCSFRIRLMQLDLNEFTPKKDLLHENVIINSNDLTRLNKVNLSDYQIMMPKEGVAVVLEWLYSSPICDKNAYPQILGNMSIPINITWMNNRDRAWSHYQPKVPNGNYATPNIGLKVAY